MFARKGTEKGTNMIELMHEVVIKTFDKLRNMYALHGELERLPKPSFPTPRLIFPTYRDKGVRVSEQGLRVAFVEMLIDYCHDKEINDLFYSVETPTEDKYTFSEKRIKKNPIIGEGQSGNFDLTLLGKDEKRLCLVEFKAGNVSEQAYKEVLAKLSNPNESGITRYLIHVVKDSLSDACKENLNKAIKWLYEESKIGKVMNVGYVCASLTGDMQPIYCTIDELKNKKEN